MSKKRRKSRNPGNVHTQREHKSRLILKIFEDKKECLSLYNAINQSNYDNPDDLIVTTLDDVIYLGMKNDMSFLLDYRMNLYEAQSTWNPNMPLRGVFYFSSLYKAYVEEHNLDIYSRTLLKLPTPQYIVFYNGTTEEPDRQVLRLSDSYWKKENYALECTAIVLNINLGHNKELMEKCRKLYEYSYLVAEIRKNQEKGLTIHAAINEAVQTCIEQGILADFLRKHRAEVNDLILTEYNEDLHNRTLREEGYEDGMLDGLKRVNRLNNYLIKEKRFADLERATEDILFQKKLMEEYGIE